MTNTYHVDFSKAGLGPLTQDGIAKAFAPLTPRWVPTPAGNPNIRVVSDGSLEYNFPPGFVGVSSAGAGNLQFEVNLPACRNVAVDSDVLLCAGFDVALNPTNSRMGKLPPGIFWSWKDPSTEKYIDGSQARGNWNINNHAPGADLTGYIQIQGGPRKGEQPIIRVLPCPIVPGTPFHFRMAYGAAGAAWDYNGKTCLTASAGIAPEADFSHPPHLQFSSFPGGAGNAQMLTHASQLRIKNLVISVW